MAYEAALAALSDPTRRLVFERILGAPRAFALFADDLARWWPLSRVHTGPRSGGLRDRAGLVGGSSNVRPMGARRHGEQCWPMIRPIVSPFPGLSNCRPGWSKWSRSALPQRIAVPGSS